METKKILFQIISFHFLLHLINSQEATTSINYFINEDSIEVFDLSTASNTLNYYRHTYDYKGIVSINNTVNSTFTSNNSLIFSPFKIQSANMFKLDNNSFLFVISNYTSQSSITLTSYSLGIGRIEDKMKILISDFQNFPSQSIDFITIGSIYVTSKENLFIFGLVSNNSIQVLNQNDQNVNKIFTTSTIYNRNTSGIYQYDNDNLIFFLSRIVTSPSPTPRQVFLDMFIYNIPINQLRIVSLSNVNFTTTKIYSDFRKINKENILTVYDLTYLYRLKVTGNSYSSISLSYYNTEGNSRFLYNLTSFSNLTYTNIFLTESYVFLTYKLNTDVFFRRILWASTEIYFICEGINNPCTHNNTDTINTFGSIFKILFLQNEFLSVIPLAISTTPSNLYRMDFLMNSLLTSKQDSSLNLLSCRQDETLLYYETTNKFRCEQCKNGFPTANQGSCSTDFTSCLNGKSSLLTHVCYQSEMRRSNEALFNYNNFYPSTPPVCKSDQVLVNYKCINILPNEILKKRHHDYYTKYCPIGTFEFNNTCNPGLCSSDNEIYSPILNRCVDCIYPNRRLNLLTNTCVEACPSSNTSEESSFYCTCSNRKVLEFNIPSSTCSVNCTLTLGKNVAGNNICMNITNPFIYQEGDCGEKMSINQTTGYCDYTRCTSGEVFYKENCLQSCPVGFGKFENLTTNNYECKECSQETDSPYYYMGKCYSQCPDGLFNLPYIDLDNSTIITNFTCVKTCPERSEIYYDDYNRICSLCNSTAYFYNNECREKCPNDTFPNPTDLSCFLDCDPKSPDCIPKCNQQKSRFFNKTSMKCEACSTENPYVDQGECVKSCKIKSISDENNNCLNCGLKEFLDITSNKCVNKCQSTDFLDYDKGICQNCFKKKMYYNTDKGRCQYNCPSDRLWNDNVGCFLKTKVIFNGTVKDLCPLDKQVNLVSRVCENCTKYMYNSTCIDKCGKNLFPDKDNNCVICSSLKKFLQNGTCVDQCTSEFEYDDFLKECVKKGRKINNNTGLISNNNTNKSFSTLLQSNGNFSGFALLEKECKCIKDRGECNSDLLKDSKDELCPSCICQNGYNGRYCEMIYDDFIKVQSKLNQTLSLLPQIEEVQNKTSDYSKNGLTPTQSQVIIDLGNMIKSVPSLISIVIVDLIGEIIRNEFSKISSNQKIDNNIFNYSSSYYFLSFINSCPSLDPKSYKKRILKSASYSLDSLKSDIQSNLPLFIKVNSINLNILYRESYILIETQGFTVYFFRNTQSGYDLAVKNSLPYIDTSSCDDTSTSTSTSNQENNFQLITVWNTNPNQSGVPNTVFSALLINQNNEKTDFPCKRLPSKLPSNNEIILNKLETYKINIKNYEFDIFNKTSSFFSNYCQPYSLNDFDMTISSRQLYYNISITCLNGCKYNGIDSNGYVICMCSTTMNQIQSMFNYSFYNRTDFVSSKVLECTSFSSEGVWSNLGFLTYGIVSTCIFLVIVIYHYLLHKKLLTIHIDKVAKNDGYINENIKNMILSKDFPAAPVRVGGNDENDKKNVDDKDVPPKKEDDTGRSSSNLNSNNQSNQPGPSPSPSPLKSKKNSHNQDLTLNENQTNPVESKLSNTQMSPFALLKKKDQPITNNFLLKNNKNQNSIQLYQPNNISQSIEPDFFLVKYEKSIIKKPFSLQVKEDSRSFVQYFKSRLLRHHILFRLFKVSITESFHIKSLVLLLDLTFILGFNLILFTESYINSRSDYVLYESGKIFLGFTFLNEYLKYLFSILFSWMTIIVIRLILTIPPSFEDELNCHIIRKDKKMLSDAYSKFFNKMKIKYYIITVLSLGFCIFFWIYATAFCFVFQMSAKAWLQSCIISIFLDWFGFKIFFQVLLCLIRQYAIKKKSAEVYDYFTSVLDLVS